MCELLVLVMVERRGARGGIYACNVVGGDGGRDGGVMAR